MYEDLFELMVEGAFADRAEFDAFINDEEVTPEDIYSLITEGAFKDYEEFQSVYATNDVIDSEVKKKTNLKETLFRCQPNKNSPTLRYLHLNRMFQCLHWIQQLSLIHI